MLLLGAVPAGCKGPAPTPDVASSQVVPLGVPGTASGLASAPEASVPRRPSAAPPRVALDGTSAPLPQHDAKVWVYSRAPKTWVFASPSPAANKIGYLRTGARLATGSAAVGREGCPGGWYGVAPAGFVCVGREATLAADDPIVRATRDYPPDVTRKLPYVYGTVRKPGPVYRSLPDAAALAKSEPDLAERMKTWLSAEGEVGASYAQHVWLGGRGQAPDPRAVWQERRTDGVPEFLLGGGVLSGGGADDAALSRMKPRVGYSFLTTWLYEGRRYGLTVEREIVPTDRLRPIQGSDFHGYLIGSEVKFPFAIVRTPTAHLWIKQGKGLADAGTVAYRASLSLTGKQQFFSGRLHFETTDGKWVSDQDASRFDPIKRMPKWGKSGERWIDVNVTKQALMLIDGEREVFATLVSTGEAGLEDPQHSTATKRGIFRIHTKHVTATMDSDAVGEEFELRDVPYVQYFADGYALHGAYWHDRFGTPKSHGCINLAPEDARRIFFFTEPEVPPGWHGALLPLKGTVVFVHP